MLQRPNSTFFVQKCCFDCFFHSCLFLFRNFSIAVLLSFMLTKIGWGDNSISQVFLSFVALHFFIYLLRIHYVQWGRRVCLFWKILSTAFAVIVKYLPMWNTFYLHEKFVYGNKRYMIKNNSNWEVFEIITVPLHYSKVGATTVNTIRW